MVIQIHLTRGRDSGEEFRDCRSRRSCVVSAPSALKTCIVRFACVDVQINRHIAGCWIRENPDLFVLFSYQLGVGQAVC